VKEEEIMPDRYLRAILTIIAIELLWLGVKDIGTHVSAQARPAPTPVVITGVDISPTATTDPTRSSLPVHTDSVVRVEASNVIKVEANRPIPVMSAAPLKVEADQPLVVETGARPLKIDAVPYTPGQKPGE
jgi:hypothetical protein